MASYDHILLLSAFYSFHRSLTDTGRNLYNDFNKQKEACMAKVTLGKTGITVEKNSFGALPIQRISTEEAVKLLRRAYSHGVTFYDTADRKSVV